MSNLWVLVGFHIFILLILAFDLGVLQQKPHPVSFKEAAIWSILWISLALGFAFGIWKSWHWWHPEEPEHGTQKAVEFLTGYLIEKALSIDNLFVFLVIFRYFGVPAELQHRVLLWGILGALVTRAVLIVLGAAVLAAFHWMLYVFAVFILYTSVKMLRSVEAEIDPGRNPLLKWARRFFPMVDGYDSSRFWVRRGGRWYATPLPLVLLVIESTDVVFATDSIPAIFGITSDAFIVYTSNIFAILGLRALYFLLASFLGRFRYLHVGLALVLAFVGLKMLAEEPLTRFLKSIGMEQQDVIFVSLGIIAAILGVSVVVSLVAGPKEPRQRPREAVAESPPEVS